MGRALHEFQADAEYQWAAEIVGLLDDVPVHTRLRLVEALASVRREDFIDSAFQSRAREDVSVPIGFSQTLSRPSTVAQVLAALELKEHDKVLEVGSGSGYLCAVLSFLVAEVFAVERIGPLAKRSRDVFDRLMLRVQLKVGDGLRGWPQFSPFDAIVVSAALKGEPRLLLSQLAVGGRLIAPLESGGGRQELVLWHRLGDEFSSRLVGECQFVQAC